MDSQDFGGRLRAAPGQHQDYRDDESLAEPAPERQRWFKRVGNRLKVFRRSRRKGGMEAPNPSSGLRILVVTDAWAPQVNGVVRTLETLGTQLERFGNEVEFVTPSTFRTVPMPTYPEIRLALFPNRKLAKIINRFRPHAIHIATEGPLGMAARRFCLRRDHPFTTSLHTRFPEYVHARLKLPVSWGYAYLRYFHNKASSVMVATETLKQEMAERGIRNLRIWSRGVDTSMFKPLDVPPEDILPYERPVWLSVGRVAVEKNLEAFLKLDLPGTKVIVGDGPQKASLAAIYPDVVFLGPRFGEELAQIYAASDVFVFPSKTDTFGLVNVEALASGTPVAAYPVQGPADIFEDGTVGALSEDLRDACLRALNIASPEACRAHAERFSWDNCTRQFLVNLDLPGFDEAYWRESAKLPD